MMNENTNNTIGNLTVQERLARAEKLIAIAKQTREDAFKAKTESATKLKMCEEELAKLGVTPSNATEELARISKEIEDELNAIDSKIPIDLLQALQRIP